MNSQHEEIPCPAAGCPWVLRRAKPVLTPLRDADPGMDSVSYLGAMVSQAILDAAGKDEGRLRAHLRGHSRQALGDAVWRFLYERE